MCVESAAAERLHIPLQLPALLRKVTARLVDGETETEGRVQGLVFTS